MKLAYLFGVSRILPLIGLFPVLWFIAAAPIHAEDLSNIKSLLAAKQCPASEYSRITFDDRDCGFSAQKECDQHFRAPSQDWQDCYSKMNLCRKQIDADNQVIDEANRVFRECHKQKSDTIQSSTGNPQKSGPSSPISEIDLAGRLAAQRANSANSDDVRRQQDQQFNNTVRSTQQEYEQAHAQAKQQEQAVQAAHIGQIEQCNSRGGEYQNAIISRCNGDNYCIGASDTPALNYIERCIDQVNAGNGPTAPPSLSSQRRTDSGACPPGYYKNGMYCVSSQDH